MAGQKLNDKWFRFLGIPFFALMGHIIFYNRNDTGEERFGFWGIYLLSLIETMILWEANRFAILYFRRKYPALDQTTKRMLMILLACTVITIFLRTLNIYVYDKTLFWGYQFPLEGYLHSIFVSLLFVIILGCIYEAIYYFRKWKDLAVESETLKKENLQTQLDSLKRQLSPHFLFNSLGSLSSLIEEDPRKAQEFVNEMSCVYRYLLQSNESNLTTLRTEMEFIRAYSNMLQTRFPDGLQLQTDIKEIYLDYHIPPLTVQILLENAVKHNAVLPGNPLIVKIYTDGSDNLIVVNNLHRKTSAVPSNKMGLSNIMSKYKLLNQREIQITETENDFLVKVPLIKNIGYAGIDS
ncbi:sensor histidine kinase [Flavihumibacter profundi]|jgi:sensor histidine kinase YesM|uniref:sensor histidine kinase n=1 Tax=Flavihumibacter profundi TaxID=2716883 RepID=UPI001CC55DCE|nr:histidine kinase [Flavihumibacter profundi]MBZ5855961.1 histidine kinase [Flavihumibacter profundi]